MSFLCLTLASVGRVAGLLSLKHPEDFAFGKDQKLIAIDLYRAAAVLAKHHFVTDFYVEGTDFAVVESLTGAHGEHFALARLLRGGIRQNDAAGGLGLFFEARAADGSSLPCISLTRS